MAGIIGHGAGSASPTRSIVRGVPWRIRTRATGLHVVLLLAACELGGDPPARVDPASLPPFRLPAGPPRLVVRGDQACAVQRDASARCWRIGDAPAPLAGAGVLQVSLGDRQHCLLQRGGSVVCRSALTDSMPERPTPSLEALADVVQLAGAELHTCALGHDGSVSCWGDAAALGAGEGERLRPQPVRGMPPIRKLAASGRHTCALAREGSVFCWGRGAAGALGDGTTRDRAAPVRVAGVSGAIDVAVTDDASCALAANGAIRCWGTGPLATGPDGAASPTPRVVTTVEHAMGLAAGPGRLCALRQGGTVSCGSPREGLHPVEGLRLIEEVGIGTRGTCALAQGGAVLCWSGSAAPTRVPDLPREQGGTGAGSG